MTVSRAAHRAGNRCEQRRDRGKGDTDFPVERDPQPVTGKVVGTGLGVGAGVGIGVQPRELIVEANVAHRHDQMTLPDSKRFAMQEAEIS